MDKVSKILQNVIPSLFTLAVFSLIWRQGNILLSGVPKPFEALIVIVAGLVLFGLTTGRIPSSSVRALKPVVRLYGSLFAALLFFSVLGNLVSAVTFPESSRFRLDIAAEYGRALFVFALFFLTVYLVRTYKKVMPWTLGALATAPLVMLAAFVPRWQDFFVENGRLIGAQADPNYLASFIALGILVSAIFFLYERSRVRWLGLINIFFITPTFLWTNSRAALVSMAITMFALTVLYIKRKSSFVSVRNILLLFGIFVLSFAGSFTLLPSDSQVLIYERTISPFVSSEDFHEISKNIHAEEGRPAIRAVKLEDIEFNQSFFNRIRGRLWGAGVVMLARAPLGFGFSFYRWNLVAGVGAPHNTWLEVGLTSGWGGLAVFITLIGIIFVKVSRLFKDSNWMGISVGFAVIYILLNASFLDMFTLRWLWLIIGMVVGYSFLKEDETKSISTSPNP